MSSLAGQRQLSCLALLAILFMVAATVISQEEEQPREVRTLSIEKLFHATGNMGDTRNVSVRSAFPVAGDSGRTCIRVSYRFGRLGWAGVFWQNRADNWGQWPGNDYTDSGFTQLVFLTKGFHGGERIEFKSGWINDPELRYRDSYSSVASIYELSSEWQRIVIDLDSLDLSSVIGGFCWTANQQNNEGDSVVFYLDSIRFE